jgi:hypothetical protein
MVKARHGNTEDMIDPVSRISACRSECWDNKSKGAKLYCMVDLNQIGDMQKAVAEITLPG